MNLRRIKHMIFRLSTEEKVLGIGALIVLIGSFLPWYSVVFNYKEQGSTESGFSGDLGVIGFIVFLLTLMSLALLMAEHLHLKLPQFGHKKEKIILFLMGESAFLLLLAVAIYTKRSLEYTNAELRFGLYLSLIGAFVSAFASYAQIQRLQKKIANDFFDHPEDKPANREINPENDISEDETPKSAHKGVEKNAKSTEKTQQKSFFYENEASSKDEMAELQNEADEIENEDNYFENPSEDIADDESAEDIDLGIGEAIPEDINEFIGQKEDDETEIFEKPTTQEGYFMKEAGIKKNSAIKVDIESIRPVEKTEKKPALEEELTKKTAKNEPANEKINFYDDL